MREFFTAEERKIMQQCGVPDLVAYQRINLLKWDRERALTQPLGINSKNRKRTAQ